MRQCRGRSSAATHRIPGLGRTATELLELVQCAEGLMQTVGSVNFLGTPGHHAGLEQSCIQGLLQVSLVSGTGPAHCGPLKAPKRPTSDTLALTWLTVWDLLTSMTAPPRK